VGNPPNNQGRMVKAGGCLSSVSWETADCTTAPAGQRVDAVIPNAAHSINMSKGAPVFYALTFDWLTEHGLGPSAP
jgi:hypothetical protein